MKTEDATNDIPVGHPLTQTIIEGPVVIKESVVSRGAVEMNKSGPKGGQMTSLSIVRNG